MTLELSPDYSGVGGGSIGQVYNEAAFKYFLAVDRTRLQRLERSVVLVLVSIRRDTGRNAPIADASAAALFDPILEDSKQVALLLDAEGLISAGEYRTAEGADLGPEMGAHLTGVSDEADRAMRHFGLGAWTRMVIETEAAVVAMAPVADAMMLVAAPRDVPLGFARRTLERCLGVARTWLEQGR